MPKDKSTDRRRVDTSVGLDLPYELYLNVRMYCLGAGITVRQFFIDALSARLGRVTGKPLPKAKKEAAA